MDVLLERRGTLPLEEAIPIFRQICIALQHIHDAGVVHRDLKPSNVLIAKSSAGDCMIKLADFGIAKQTNKDQKLTETGAVLGSPLYMSPEQNLGQPLDG